MKIVSVHTHNHFCCDSLFPFSWQGEGKEGRGSCQTLWRLRSFILIDQKQLITVKISWRRYHNCYRVRQFRKEILSVWKRPRTQLVQAVHNNGKMPSAQGYQCPQSKGSHFSQLTLGGWRGCGHKSDHRRRF